MQIFIRFIYKAFLILLYGRLSEVDAPIEMLCAAHPYAYQLAASSTSQRASWPVAASFARVTLGTRDSRKGSPGRWRARGN